MLFRQVGTPIHSQFLSKDMVSLARITVAQAATVISAAITFIQYTLGLALVALLVYMIPPANTAISWTSITRTLHSSIWPTLLRTDSTASGTSWRVSGFSTLTLFVGILIVMTGIITPLGLKDGPLLLSPARLTNSSYIPDTSPIGLATSPRDHYYYTRTCGVWGPVPCPGNGNNGNTSQIAPSMVKIFSSTPYGPFGMQFRQYYHGVGGYNYSMLRSALTIFESLILRDDIFAVEGLIVDLRTESPGVGFWNHTLPELGHGGEWSQDVLWLEPVTSCVNSNLTIDYTMESGFVSYRFNLTDRGGFVNLAWTYPIVSRNGQDGNLYDHAFKGAALSNRFAMTSLNNLTRDQSYVGKTFPLNSTSITGGLKLGQMGPINLVYLSNPQSIGEDMDEEVYLDIACTGYGGGDEANITNTGVHCGMFAGTPERSDGGDSRLSDDNSTWTQSLYTCASVTRARIQTITFSFDGQPDLSKLRITRRNASRPILWATERASINITDVNLLWGHVDDSYEGDPSLSTIRSEVFYVPAGTSDIWGRVASPNTVPAAALAESYLDSSDFLAHYNGQGNYALLHKFESMIKNDPINGPARIRNLIWTDILANNLVGNMTNNRLTVAAFKPSISYQLIFAIPAIILFTIWLFAFLAAVFALAFGSLTISYLRDLINHTSAGRVIVGDSCLTVTCEPSATDDSTPFIKASRSESLTSSLMVGDNPMHADGAIRNSSSINLDTQSWAKTTGLSLVEFSAARPADLDR